MELMNYLMGIVTGAEIAGATLTGRGARLAIAAAAAVASLALPETVDPVMVLVEFVIARRVG